MTCIQLGVLLSLVLTLSNCDFEHLQHTRRRKTIVMNEISWHSARKLSLLKWKHSSANYQTYVDKSSPVSDCFLVHSLLVMTSIFFLCVIFRERKFIIERFFSLSFLSKFMQIHNFKLIFRHFSFVNPKVIGRNLHSNDFAKFAVAWS